MSEAHAFQQIQQLYANGDIHTGIKFAKRYIKEHGEKESQSIIYLLADGLFAANYYYEAHYWANRTTVYPESLRTLKERIDNKIRL